MGTKTKQSRNGQQTDRTAVAAPTATRHDKRCGHLFTAAENSKPVIVLEGITLEGIYAEMQRAYLTVPDRNTKDPASVRRWRKLFLSRPDKFLAILANEEKRVRDNQAAAVAHRSEFERLQAEFVRLRGQNGELAAELKRSEAEVARLTALLPSGEDVYADQSVERVDKLAARLLAEYGVL